MRLVIRVSPVNLFGTVRYAQPKISPLGEKKNQKSNPIIKTMTFMNFQS